MVALNMSRTYDVKWVISKKRIGFDDFFDVTECLQQIAIPNLLHMCARSKMTNHLI